MTSKKHVQLSAEQADQILANVFQVCRLDPNTVSLDTLEDYSNYRAERFSRVIGSKVYLYVYDDDTEVDYSSVTATDSDGNNVDPIDVIPEEQCIIFQCPSTVTSVNIADKKGNILQLTLRPTR